MGTRSLILHRLNVVAEDGLDLNTPLVLDDSQEAAGTQPSMMVPVRSRGIVKVFLSFQMPGGSASILAVGYDWDRAGAGGFDLVGPLGPGADVSVATQYVVQGGKFAGDAPALFDCAGVEFVQVWMRSVINPGAGIDVHLKFA